MRLSIITVSAARSIRKIDNFLPSRLTRSIVFQNLDQPGWRFPYMM
jgi:hypothetical protein